MMNDIEGRFLERQCEQAAALAGQSDILELGLIDPRHIVAQFDCIGLVRDGNGAVKEHRGFVVGFFLHEGYTRRVIEPMVVRCFEPDSVWHPNVRGALCCLGPIMPATPLVDLIYRTYELLTYQNYGTLEGDALRQEACAWVRRNADRLPTDTRPLKRRDSVAHESSPTFAIDPS